MPLKPSKRFAISVIFFSLNLFLLSIGLLTPKAARSAEHDSVSIASSQSQELVSQTPISQALTSQAIEASSVDINAQIEGAGDITREYTFRGNANETVVAYWELLDRANDSDNVYNFLYYGGVVLLDENGQAVQQEYAYPRGITLDEVKGRHSSFRLPATGEYRLVFSSQVSGFPELPGFNTTESRNYLMRIRTADYHERLMLYVVDLLAEERFEEALSMLSMAISHKPDTPMAYYARVYITGLMADAEQPDKRFETLGEGFEDERIEAIYELFQSLTPEQQSLVISDLRRAGELYGVAVEQGKITNEDIGFEYTLFEEAIKFVQTGTPSEALREFVYGEF